MRHGLGTAVHQGRDDGTSTLGHLHVEAGAVALAPCRGSVHLDCSYDKRSGGLATSPMQSEGAIARIMGWVGGRWRPWRGITHRFETAKRR